MEGKIIECGCEKKDFEEALKFLPIKELSKLKEKDEITAECEVCKKKHVLSSADIENIIIDLSKDSELGCSTTNFLGCTSCNQTSCKIKK